MSGEPDRPSALGELLDEESIAVVAILLAVALEFGFGFAKTVGWWAGVVAGPAAFGALLAILRVRASRVLLVRFARWVVRGERRTGAEAG
ncbi:MAG TPA: hypothetical protein VFJ91_12585 [Gaiellaceae bacterium]|nr:hypothetical protein [Gaiellaceae bacterium]